jgi:hypothetical protein
VRHCWVSLHSQTDRAAAMQTTRYGVFGLGSGNPDQLRPLCDPQSISECGHDRIGPGHIRFALGLEEGGSFPGSSRAISEWFPAKERASTFGPAYSLTVRVAISPSRIVRSSTRST